MHVQDCRFLEDIKPIMNLSHTEGILTSTAMTLTIQILDIFSKPVVHLQILESSIKFTFLKLIKTNWTFWESKLLINQENNENVIFIGNQLQKDAGWFN